jgi:hypothetical protein
MGTPIYVFISLLQAGKQMVRLLLLPIPLFFLGLRGEVRRDSEHFRRL